MTNQIAVRDESIEDLEHSFAIAVRQRELLAEYIKQRLTPGKHFYQVGESKNSLTKEGAELICLPHGYKPAYVVEGGPDQPADDDIPYQITVRCTLMKGDIFEGEGMGSASSHITKRDGQRIPRQPDVGLRHNATLKMAQKSAYIAATLNATAASEFFTQDMEPEEGRVAERVQDVAGEFFCAKHQTPWFKRGKMRNYAHPIGDTKEWCNMPSEDAMTNEQYQASYGATPPAVERTEAPASPSGAASVPVASATVISDRGSLNTESMKLGYNTEKSRMEVPGFQAAIEAHVFTKAYGLLVAAKAGKA